jgi:hypothetical protein
MRITEIESQMLSNTETMRILQKQVAELSKQNSYLSELKENKLTELFVDYIELGTNYTFDTYAYLNGVQTGVKTGFKSPNFQDGDVIRFDKKNKKSIVITCLSKSEHKIVNGVRVITMSSPNWVFRIDISSLYHFMLKRPDFKERFDAYVRRKESLELLGI